MTIGPDGQVHLQVRGVKGRACLDITAPLEEALGGVIAERRLTYEADEQPQAEEELQQRERRRRSGGGR